MTFEFAGPIASQYGDWSNRFNWDAREAAMHCTCTPAIAGISDGPSVDCPIHGSIGAVNLRALIQGVLDDWAGMSFVGASDIQSIAGVLDHAIRASGHWSE